MLQSIIHPFLLLRGLKAFFSAKGSLSAQSSVTRQCILLVSRVYHQVFSLCLRDAVHKSLLVFKFSPSSLPFLFWPIPGPFIHSNCLLWRTNALPSSTANPLPGIKFRRCLGPPSVAVNRFGFSIGLSKNELKVGEGDLRRSHTVEGWNGWKPKVRDVRMSGTEPADRREIAGRIEDRITERETQCRSHVS
jgi:hypothetical protein